MKIITTVLRFGSINFLRFLAALCRFILVKENREKLGLDCIVRRRLNLFCCFYSDEDFFYY